jgi:REP element-mobilizing transposase RayT
MATLGYFITFHTYGTWLHGRAGGSVDDDHATPGTPFLPLDLPRYEREQQALKHPPVTLDDQRRFVVDATIREVCTHRTWRLHALHVRTTHVHIVVCGDHSPERMMTDFKAYCTRRMREALVLSKEAEPWSHHGSTRYLNTERSFRRAMQYVLDQQGEPLDMRCPPGWTPKRQQTQGANEPRA